MTSCRAVATATVACTLAAAGCSFSGDVQGSAAPVAGAPVRCATQDLAVSIGGPVVGAEGTTVVTIVMENTGPAPCTLLGHPDVSAVAGPQGQQVGTAAFRSDETGLPTLVTVQPGRAAHASLGLEELQDLPDATCQPVAVDGYRVHPPGSGAAAFVPRAGTTCSAPGATGPSVTPVVPEGQDS